MKQICILAVSIFLMAVSMAGAGESVLTMDSAIKKALAANPDIVMTRFEVKRAQALSRQARALFYPRLTLFSELITGDAPSAFLFKTIDQRALPPGVNFNDPGNFTNVETGITAEMNLYNGGRDMLTTRMADKAISASRASGITMQNQVASDVIQVYFSILKAGAYVEIAKHSIETVREQLRTMKVRFRAGGVLKSDILSLEVRLAEARKNQVEAKNLYTTTLTALTTLLAMEPADEIPLETDCICPKIFPTTYGEAVKIALEKRPEIQKARTLQEQARLNALKAKAGYYPRMDLQARYYLDSENLAFNGSNDNYTLGVRMQWNIFNGHATRSAWDAACQELALAREGVRKTELWVKQEVKQACLGYENADQKLKVAVTSVDMAKESLNLVRQRYQGGSEPVTRYLETELARNRAEINRATAYYDKKIAMSRIGKAMGTLAELWEEN